MRSAQDIRRRLEAWEAERAQLFPQALYGLISLRKIESEVRTALDTGGDPNEVYRRAPLIWHAVISKQPTVVRELLARGARVWDTLREDATWLGNRAVIELLRAHTDKR